MNTWGRLGDTWEVGALEWSGELGKGGEALGEGLPALLRCDLDLNFNGF